MPQPKPSLQYCGQLKAARSLSAPTHAYPSITKGQCTLAVAAVHLLSLLSHRRLISYSRKNPWVVAQMISASCVAQRCVRSIIGLQYLI